MNKKLPPRIGGVSTRFGIGILYGSRISFATRLKNGEIAIFSKDTTQQSIIQKVPFLRSILVFRQIILVFLLARKNLIQLAKKDLINLQRGKRLIHGLVFISLYIGFFAFLDPALLNLTPILRTIILILSIVILIRLFFFLVLGDQSLKYHGAEHKVINTFLAGDALTLNAAQNHTRFAFRCGTTLATFFILVELFIPEKVYAFFIHIFGSTVGFLIIFFLILGFAYETLTILSKKGSNKLFSLLAAPILKMQLLTTREPSINELEVGLSAIRSAVGWQPPLSEDFIFSEYPYLIKPPFQQD